MSRKNTIQNFEDFTGEDVTLSPLRTDTTSAVRMQNLEKMHNGSLRGRPGLKIASQMICMRQIGTYEYIDDDDVLQKEVVGLGYLDEDYVTLFRLKKGEFSVTCTSGATWGISILPATASDAYTVTILEGVNQIASYSLGNGYVGGTGYKTLSALATLINIESDYTCVAPQTAVVNGAQTAKVITVDSGHTVSVGDIVEVNPISAGSSQIHQTSVAATSATTLTFTTEGNMTVADNDIIGHGNFPAATLNLQVDEQNTTATKTFDYYFWEQVPYLYLEHTTALSRTGLFTTNGPTRRNLGKTQPSMVNHRNCLYITGTDVEYLKMKQYIEFEEVGDVYAGVYKYDGKRVRMAGCPRDDLDALYLNPGIKGTSASPLPAGTYYYRYSVTICDCQDNEIEYFSEFEHVHPASGVLDSDVEFFNPDLDYPGSTTEPRLWNIISATLTAATSSTNTLTITSGHNFRVGDYIYFREGSNQTVTKRRVTSFTLTTVVFNGGTVSVSNGEIVSNARFRLWRTKVDSKQYLLNREFPWEVVTTTYITTYDDTVSDANLGITLESVKPELEQFPLPPANAISNIQGILVAGGGQRSGNQINWESPNTPEFSPQETNNYPLPVKSSGDVQAFIEGVFSGLMILKNRAQYSSGGSFGEASVEINKDAENGYGANNPYGVTEADQIIVGVSSLGLWLNNQGQNVKNFGRNYYKYFRQCSYDETTKLRHTQSTIYYDSVKNWIHVFLPAYTNADDEFYPNTNSKHLVYMIDSQCWAEFTYGHISMYPSAGIAEDNDNFYQAGFYDDSGFKGYLYRRLEGETTDPKYDFHDNASTYDYDLLTAWDDDGDPEHDKVWSELVVYSLQSDCYADAYTINFSSYRDWSETAGKIDTERTSSLVFDASTVVEQKFQFDKGYKAKRRALRFYGTIDLNPPLISGYSYLLASDQYRKGRLD